MGNPLDITGRCTVCGERCESTGGCDCSAEDYNHVPLKRVWKRTLVDAAELAALHQRAEKAENREQQLRVEIKTLRDEKAALEARVAELRGRNGTLRFLLESLSEELRIVDDKPWTHKRKMVWAAKIQAVLDAQRIDAALEEGGK